MPHTLAQSSSQARRSTKLNRPPQTPTKRRRHHSPSPSRIPSPTKAPPTNKELYQWTFTADAIAPCFIGDALHMRYHDDHSYDFYWLGRVPCRIVQFVGILVGVQVMERKIVYTVDDGTGVIDCDHPQRVTKPPPKTNITKFGDFFPPAHRPIAKIGSFVSVTGKVGQKFETRAVSIDNITVCSTPNDELIHCRRVRELHKSFYSLTEPFIIPISAFIPATPKTPATVKLPPSPLAPPGSQPSSVASSPIKPILPSSPVKAHDVQTSTRLRHPSRLRSGDLTENTFRIYLKHYMDNANTLSPEEDSEDESNWENSPASLTSTPVKRLRLNQSDSTPRPKRLFAPESTPQASKISRKAPVPSSSPPSSKPEWRGFTLSYLRRVPELRLLGSRVVHAIARRQARKERHKLRDMGLDVSRAKKPTSPPPAKVNSKMKRLFQWAIVQSLQDGGIILWDGRVRAWSKAPTADCSHLWRVSSSTMMDGSTINTLGDSVVTEGYSNFDEEDDVGNISDPAPDEEAYISVTPGLFADQVEGAMKTLLERYQWQGKSHQRCTPEAILSQLKKDDRWHYVGDWSVNDALSFLQKDGRAYCSVKGTWGVTEMM